MDEDRDGCRHSFHPLVTPMIANTSSTGEAALLINKDIWSLKDYWDIHFKPNQSPEILSPSQVTFFRCLLLSSSGEQNEIQIRAIFEQLTELSKAVICNEKFEKMENAYTGMPACQALLFFSGCQGWLCVMYRAQHLPSLRSPLCRHSS